MKIINIFLLSTCVILIGDTLKAKSFEEYQKTELANAKIEKAAVLAEKKVSLTTEDRVIGLEDKIVSFEEQIKAGNHPPENEYSISRGKTIYTKLCHNCHGDRGQGNGRLSKAIKNLKSLASSSMWDRGDQFVFDSITNGKPPMPSYGKRLSDEERWHIVNYIKTFAPKSNEMN